jgi:UPF0755 protein
VSRAVKLVLSVVAAAILVVAILGVQFRNFVTTPVSVPPDGAQFEIKPGSSFGQVSRQLADRGIITQPEMFRWYARLSGNAGAVQAGEYFIEAGTTAAGLLDKFVSGVVQLYSFTIVEGWTFRELIAALNASDLIENGVVYEDWPAVLLTLNSDLMHPEGLFLPETYRFPKGTRDIDILRQAYELMQETLAVEWAGRATNLPLQSPYEALILASIVEKETALADERPRIAGVFVRRLQERMRLQTDPTVIYGIGTGFNGNLTRNDLRNDTPYNTYTRGGLPPTPIALPGKAAINAALNPAEGSELYFVATGFGDGSHKFSDTKEQHDQAVQEYLRRQRAARNQQPGRQ